MSTVEVRVPDIGDFKNVEVIEVHVSPGDTVRPEDPLITLESDKASMEVPAPQGGIVGELRIKKGGSEQLMFISGGFVEVRPDKVIIMADLAEHSDEIDEARAVEARKRAEQELGEVKDPVDIARVRAALQTALMRERIATRRRSRG